MVIPNRLKTIASFIEPGEKVADVGADHGLLEIYLITRNTNNGLVAIENKKGPYKPLYESLVSIKNIRLSLTDGLTAVDRDVDTVVLAGMGGLNIIEILDKFPQKVAKINKIITDAHRDLPEARKVIINYGFKIEKEKIVFENNKFYVISVFVKSPEINKYSEDAIEFGYKLYEDELWPKYSEHLIEQNNKKINGMKENPSNKDAVNNLIKSNERIAKYGKN